VTHSDYIFRLLECNQGCDLLKMILHIFIVLMRNGSFLHCSRDFNILGCISTSVGNSVNGERIMTN